MPVKPLPVHPDLDHLKYQAKDLLKRRGARDAAVAQRIREFHPGFSGATDARIFAAPFRLSDAQLTIARERGFASWARLKRQVETPQSSARHDLPHHERIDDVIFRRSVDLLDAGDVAGLRAHLATFPDLIHRHVVFEGGNYFRSPTLLEFIAENPIRRGSLPANIVEVATVILDAGAGPSSVNETLGLVCSGMVVRQCSVQVPLIDLLCDRGADADSALMAAAVHGEFEAVHALLRRGAHLTLPLAAALGREEDARRVLAAAGSEDRHRALALAAQFGHVGVVRLLLDAGEDPSRYNPVGAHSHSTPLHQAALAGHGEVARLLVERGALLDRKDTMWQGTPADWANHGGQTEMEIYLRAQESRQENDAESS